MGNFRRVINFWDEHQMSVINFFQHKTIPKEILPKVYHIKADGFPVSFEEYDSEPIKIRRFTKA